MSERSFLISLNDTVVGHIWSDGSHSLFSLHDQYLNAPDRPVLGQYFEDRLQKRSRRVRGMHPWFENILPEQSGALRRRYCRLLDIDPMDSMGLLGALGNDLPGAVRILTDAGEPPTLDIVDEERPSPLSSARFSLGGMQLKFSMSGEPERLLLGVADRDGMAWILKIGTPNLPMLAENENAIMNWCRSAGFDVPETHVVPADSLPDLGMAIDAPSGFLVRRYDRLPRRRIHQEDFSQVLNSPPDRKYRATDAAGLLDLAQQILGPEGAEEGLRRLAASVATGNCDAHIKNWSLIYADEVTASWSPLYDQVCTAFYPHVDRKMSLRIGTARHMNEVDLSHFRWVGEKAGIPPESSEQIVEATLRSMAGVFSYQTSMPPALERCLREHWRKVPVLRQYALG